jgi:hypothetical protein
MRIDSIRVFGFEPAFHGMRNPQDSWDKSDSLFYRDGSLMWKLADDFGHAKVPEKPMLGSADLQLASKLIIRGSEHRKFMRQIMLWFNITIPRYAWQELDTYKVATVRNSCSTMNKLGSRDLEQCDFQDPIREEQLEEINRLGRILREAKEEGEGVRGARVQLKNELCEGFLQKATYSCSYETALAMLIQREHHRLPLWRLECEGSICRFLMSLPYMSNFYRAATWRRDQLRNAVANLTSVIQDVRQGREIRPERLEDIRNAIKKAS